MNTCNFPSRAFENNVLTTFNEAFYFLPCYGRFKFEKLIEVDISSQTAVVSGALYLSIYYQGFEQFSAELIPISGHLNGHKLIVFENSPNCFFQREQDKHLISYVYMGRFDLKLQGSILLAPYGSFALRLDLTLHPKCVFNPEINKQSEVKFNFIDIPDSSRKIYLNRLDPQDHGLYGTIAGSFRLQPLNKKRVSKQQSTLQNGCQALQESIDPINDNYETKPRQQLKEFNHLSFTMRIHRYPLVPILNILLPLQILACINLSLFYAEHLLQQRLPTIIITMVAFIAFLSTIRAQIPLSASITVADIQVYLLIGTTILILLESISIHAHNSSSDVEYVFNWHQNWYFLSTLAVILGIALFQAGLLVWHFLLLSNNGSTELDCEESFEQQVVSEGWENKLCSLRFNRRTCTIVSNDELLKTTYCRTEQLIKQ